MAAVVSSSSQTPTKTVTLDIPPGGIGPTGPAGARGPAGATGPTGPPGPEQTCPPASTFGKLVINHPGGQVAIYTCIAD